MGHPDKALITNNQLIRTNRPPLMNNPAAVYISGLSKGSRRSQRQALNTIAGLLTNGKANALTCLWEQVRYQHSAVIRSILQETYKPSTANKMLSALRQVLKEAWKLGWMSAEDYHRAASIENVKGQTLPAGRDIDAGELGALMEACRRDTAPTGIRDGAMIALLYIVGIRRAELVGLEIKDYEPESNRLVVRGKGNKERLVYVTSGAIDALADWLQLRGDDLGALFWPIK